MHAPQKKEAGVRVYVLLFKEKPALQLNSFHAKLVLQDCHPNIVVFRYPDFDTLSALLWAHHDKMVVIDQSTAFVGGAFFFFFFFVFHFFH